ncbi:ATP-dependent DNA helicase DDX11 [Onthophagus taurus]|uniref:ATP-dependent DNA helicase DDX11 n=1 Tax=Onthophagus taurus TaxID=166361 RepID=UPI0039BE1497
MSECERLVPPENFDFPFPPYKIQNDFMKNLYEILEAKNLGIFESPTGTGKSLSIICGAIKWLKDHNVREREDLSNQIAELEEKKKVLDNDEDWFNAQSKGIEINNKLRELQLKQSKILEYDEKINKLFVESKKKNFKNSLKKYSNNPNIDKKEIDDLNDYQFDEDDLLINDVNHDNSSSDEEENQSNQYHPTKIFICSRTHSQLTQFVGEIIKSPFGENVRVTSLGSRQNFCINPNVNRLKNLALINDKCLDMQKNEKKSNKKDNDGKVIKRTKTVNSAKCEFFKQTNVENLKDLSLTHVLDIEDLVVNGKELKACPYYACRKAADDAEIVLVPYNSILHKATREANGIKIKDSVIIIDEAHNLLEAMVQMYSAEISYLQLFYCEKQLKGYKNRYNTRFSYKNLLRINQILFVIKNLKGLFEKNESEIKSQIFTVESFVLKAEIDNYNMFQLVTFSKESRLPQKLRGFTIKHPETNEISETQPKKGIKQFLESLENKPTPINPSTNKPTSNKQPEPTKTTPPVPSNPLLAIISFMEALTYTYDDGRILLHTSKEKESGKLQFMVLNPTEHFKEIVRDARSVVVAGGTMKPIEEFRERLFKNSGAEENRIVEFCCDHIVNKENILPVILTKGNQNESLRFNFENRFSMGQVLKEILLKACKTIPGGIVVFFPSYKYESWVWNQLKQVSFERAVFREPQQSSKVESVLENYSKTIQKTKKALLFSVVGGKLSEGLNFSDDLGRCVIVVGMPYANIKAIDLKEKMNYLNEKEGNNAGQKYYESLCMKAVNQCIGRAVRHKNDYATVILVDERYDRNSTKDSLPNWIKRSLISCDFKDCFEKIEEFFEKRD